MEWVFATNIINLMHGTVSLVVHSFLISSKNASSLLLNGELQITTSDFCDKRKNFPIFVENVFRPFRRRAKFPSSAGKSREVVIGEVFYSE